MRIWTRLVYCREGNGSSHSQMRGTAKSTSFPPTCALFQQSHNAIHRSDNSSKRKLILHSWIQKPKADASIRKVSKATLHSRVAPHSKNQDKAADFSILMHAHFYCDLASLPLRGSCVCGSRGSFAPAYIHVCCFCTADQCVRMHHALLLSGSRDRWLDG